MVGLSAVLWAALPRRAPNAGLSYPQLLRSIVELVRREPVLRRRALYGALGFGAFNVFWTSMAFLLAGPPFRYGPAIIGAFGLIGAAGATMASAAGRIADRGHAQVATGAFAATIALSFLLLYWGAGQLLPLIIGIVLLDIGSQGLHITNQTVVYQLSSAARSRITTAYMTANFTGGAMGSALSVAVFTAEGWTGVCLLGGAMGLTAVALRALELARAS